MSKLKLWEEHSSWEKAEAAWDQGAKEAASEHPLKRLKTLPQMPGMTEETARNLKWKSFRYMLFHPEGLKILRHVVRHPLSYGWRYLRSLFKKEAFLKEGDFYLYGMETLEQFLEAARKGTSLVVIGFSYCQKPHECPSGRFTPDCIHSLENPVCRQCDIGKIWHAVPEEHAHFLWIPTVHYIGDEIFKLIKKFPEKEILFLITACEMTLTMFADWGNMAGVRGIGVRLDGRICNTMKAFELSERGIKPGLTVVTEETSKRLLELIRRFQ